MLLIFEMFIRMISCLLIVSAFVFPSRLFIIIIISGMILPKKCLTCFIFFRSILSLCFRELNKRKYCGSQYF